MMGREHFKTYIGGAPKQNIQPNENLTKYSWGIPNDLQTFYSIHDGFGELYDGMNLIYQAKDLDVLVSVFEGLPEDMKFKPEGYKLEDLLEFFPDGAGNVQCFIRNSNGNNTTVDWDHETREISDEIDFFSFIDQTMSRLDEE